MNDTEKIANEIIKKFKRRSYIRDYMSNYDLEEIHFLKKGNNYILNVKSRNNDKTSLHFTHMRQPKKKEKKTNQRRDSGYSSDFEDILYHDKDIKYDKEKDIYEEYDKLIMESNEIIKKIQDYFENKNKIGIS